MAFNNKYYAFTEDSDKYAFIGRSENYDALASTLGLQSGANDKPDDAQSLTIKEAVIDFALCIPVKLEMSKSGKTRVAYVLCTKTAIDTALKKVGGLKGKKYGDWTINKAYVELDKKYTF